MTRLVTKAKKLGYEVEEVVIALDSGDDLIVYNVSGFGVNMEMQEGDFNRFLTSDIHTNRVNQARHNDPDDSFEMSESELFESNLKANVAADLIAKTDIPKLRKEWEAAHESR